MIKEILEPEKINDAWIGVDLDGTLSFYDGWVSADWIGEPIPEMAERVKKWIKEGKIIKIFTARASNKAQIPPIKKWLKKHGFGDLEIINIKDPKMIVLWDDRCVQVVKNTGKPIGSVNAG